MANVDAANGIEAVICDTTNDQTWGLGMDADIHVVHSHIPDELVFKKESKIIAVQHGSPEHIFENSLTQGLGVAYAPGDSFSITSFFLRRADAIITFWPRHAEIWETMTDKPIFCIPMGIDKSFWTPQPNGHMMAGKPVIFSAENCHTCKWPLDMILMWPKIVERIPSARFHVIHLPADQHRWWMPLAYMNGSHYTSYLSPHMFGKERLRDFFCAADYYYSPVRYGDFNRVSLEAAASGTKVISFEGNQYAHYWVREGDQRRQRKDLLNILTGEVPEREAAPVADIKDTALAMMTVYKEVIGGQTPEGNN